jgi:hypothetical protein
MVKLHVRICTLKDEFFFGRLCQMNLGIGITMYGTSIFVKHVCSVALFPVFLALWNGVKAM